MANWDKFLECKQEKRTDDKTRSIKRNPDDQNTLLVMVRKMMTSSKNIELPIAL